MKKIINLLQELNPDYDYERSDDFISDGLLDSIDLQELFAMLEEEYDVKLGGTEMAPQNFRNLETIRELLTDHGLDGSKL